MNNNNQNFTIQGIPEYINQLSNFKKWRRVGSNLKGAIMIGIIEYYIYNNEINKLKEIISQNQFQGNDKAKKLKTILESSLQNDSAIQIIDSFYEQLKLKDRFNTYAEEFLDVYFKQKFSYSLSDGELIEQVQKIFKIRLIITKWPSDKNQNSQSIDSKERNNIIISNVESRFYIIQKDQNQLIPLCQSCKNQNQKDLIKLNCQHLICLSCLKKFFSQSQNDLKCNYINCPSLIKFQEFQKLLQNVQNQPLKQNNQENPITLQDCCNICKNKISLEFLLKPIQCNHLFCMQCIEKQVQNNDQNKFNCLILGCKSKFNENQIPSTVSYKLNQSQKLQKQTEVIQKPISQDKQQSQILMSNHAKSSQININSKCHFCLNQPKDNLIYQLKCNHNVCSNCFQKLQNSNQLQFKCKMTNCNEIIKLQDLRQYFQTLQSQTQKSNCGNCDQKCEQQESFYNTNCNHCICFQCVINIYQSQKTPKCLKCNIVINEELLDKYYSKKYVQSTANVPKLQQYDPEFQMDCTFCHSPFTKYNKQQNLNCPYHVIGTCCVIFPLDCPQCQLNSLIIEKQKLQFYLFYNDLDFINYQTQGKQK